MIKNTKHKTQSTKFIDDYFIKIDPSLSIDQIENQIEEAVFRILRKNRLNVGSFFNLINYLNDKKWLTQKVKAVFLKHEFTKNNIFKNIKFDINTNGLENVKRHLICLVKIFPEFLIEMLSNFFSNQLNRSDVKEFLWNVFFISTLTFSFSIMVFIFDPGCQWLYLVGFNFSPFAVQFAIVLYSIIILLTLLLDILCSSLLIAEELSRIFNFYIFDKLGVSSFIKIIYNPLIEKQLLIEIINQNPKLYVDLLEILVNNNQKTLINMMVNTKCPKEELLFDKILKCNYFGENSRDNAGSISILKNIFEYLTRHKLYDGKLQFSNRELAVPSRATFRRGFSDV